MNADLNSQIQAMVEFVRDLAPEVRVEHANVVYEDEHANLKVYPPLTWDEDRSKARPSRARTGVGSAKTCRSRPRLEGGGGIRDAGFHCRITRSTDSIRATPPGGHQVIPTVVQEFWFPEVFGWSDARLLTIGK